MQNTLGPEAHYLALTAAFTAVIWVPIIVNRLREMGVWRALKNPEPDARPAAAWAFRADAAHRNAIENLVVFAPLAILVVVSGVGDALTAAFAAVFFYARVAHAVIYTLGVPVLRTLAFLAGFAAQVVFALRLFGMA